MLNVSNTQTLQVLGVALFAAPLVWMLVRRRHGFPALARRDSEVPAEA